MKQDLPCDLTLNSILLIQYQAEWGKTTRSDWERSGVLKE